jgi:hypothetical protein
MTTETVDAKHRAYVLRWAKNHWKRDNTQPRDMDEMLERTAVEIVELSDSRLIWMAFAFIELAALAALIWALAR